MTTTTLATPIHPGHKLLREICQDGEVRNVFVVSSCRKLYSEYQGAFVDCLDWKALELISGVAVEDYERELIAGFIQSI